MVPIVTGHLLIVSTYMAIKVKFRICFYISYFPPWNVLSTLNTSCFTTCNVGWTPQQQTHGSGNLHISLWTVTGLYYCCFRNWRRRFCGTAGFETSGSTLTYALYETALHPEIQNRLRAEIMQEFNKHDGQLTYDGIQDLAYLDMVVSGRSIETGYNINRTF